MTQFLGFGQGVISTGGHGFKWGWDCSVDVTPRLWHYFEANGVEALCGKEIPNLKDDEAPKPPVELMCPECRAVLTRRMLEEQGKENR